MILTKVHGWVEFKKIALKNFDFSKSTKTKLILEQQFKVKDGREAPWKSSIIKLYIVKHANIYTVIDICLKMFDTFTNLIDINTKQHNTFNNILFKLSSIEVITKEINLSMLATLIYYTVSV